MSTVSRTPLGSLGELTAMAAGELRAPASAPRAASPTADAPVEGVSIDTRTLAPGELFVPLPGRKADGHEFLAEAFRRGAVAALCARGRLATARADGPLVVVDDVTAALQRLARRHRASWDGLL